jgi:hypothetical protein
MTADQLAQGVRSSAQVPIDPDRRGLPATTILSICDRLLGEVGRRQHMFAWLRAPGSAAGSAAGEWLPVDAYYPRARLVVICRYERGPRDAFYREHIPAHGLGLLTLDPELMGDDQAAVEDALAGKIFDLEHVPRAGRARAGRAPVNPREAPVKPREAPVNPREAPVEAPQASEPAGPSWTPLSVERAPVAPAFEQAVGVLVGLALAGVLIAEVYLGVVEAALGTGRPLLGFAIALEACSRALGTGAAARAGERVWACACAIGGAPVVAWFAFFRPSGRVEVDPAPLAGLLAGLAGVVAILALLFGT